MQGVLGAAEPEKRLRDESLGERLGIGRDLLISSDAKVGMAVGDVGFAKPVIGFEGEAGFGPGGKEGFQSGDGFLDLVLGELDFGEEQLRLPAGWSLGLVFDQCLDEGQRFVFPVLLEEGPGEAEIGGVGMAGGVLQGEERAIFLLGFGPFFEIEERLGLPEEGVGAKIFRDLVDGDIERGNGGVAMAELIKRAGLKELCGGR